MSLFHVSVRITSPVEEPVTSSPDLILREAAGGKHLDQFLRMMKDGHELLQDAKGEEGSGGAPRRVVFKFEGDPEVPEAEAPPSEGGTGGGIMKDGQEYI